MKQIVLAVTGASGAPYAQRLAQCLVASDVHVHLVISPFGHQVIADELGIRKLTIERFIGHTTTQATLYNHRDLGAKISSGSFITDGMVVCPCSSNTLGALASGLADNLVSRAALVTMKEARRLIVVPREMPFSQIELDNLLRLSRAGAIVCPACPGFYLLPRTVGELVDFVVGRILDLLDIEHELNTRWDPQRGGPHAPAIPAPEE